MAEATAGATKTVKVWARLREDIIRGRFKPGSLMPTQRQLSAQYGVGEATVAMAMARLSQEGLVSRRRRRGTFVNDDLDQITRTIDFVRVRREVGEPERPTDLIWIEDFNEISRKRGFTARWHHLSSRDIAELDAVVDRFTDTRGIITLEKIPEQLPRIARQRGIPMVAVTPGQDKAGPPPAYHHQLLLNRRAAGRMACDHLVSLGARKIGYIGVRLAPLFLTGFLEAAQRHKLDIPIEWLVEIPDSPGADHYLPDKVLPLLQSDHRPGAFCCVSDRVASSMITLAKRHGLEVPQDLAVVSCMEGPFANAGACPITTVGISFMDVCKKAISLIADAPTHRQTGEPALHEPQMIPLRIFVRESCGAGHRNAASAGETVVVGNKG